MKITRITMFLCCLALAAMTACKGEKDKEQPKADKADTEQHSKPEQIQVERGQNGEPVLSISPEVQKRIGLATAVAQEAERPPQMAAYGTVLDPAPLLAIQGEIAASEASIGSLKVLADRARALFESGENVSRKAMEAAQTDLRLAEIKLQTTRQQFALEWGESIGRLNAAGLSELVSNLVSGKTALIRADLNAGEALTEIPTSARISPLSSDRWATATVASRAPRIDPKTQGLSFLLTVDGSAPAFRPGAAVNVFLTTRGTPVKGVAVQPSAVVIVDGTPCVYVLEKENQFARKEIKLERSTDDSSFATSGLAPGQRVVIEGAQQLLSEEQKSQIKAD